MSQIFNLTAIGKLVETEHPSIIVLIDTNILMKEPDFSNWKTSIDKPLFVFNDVNIIELQYLRSKKDSKTSGSAIEASHSLSNLFNKGKISDGIHIENIGWFISVPSTKENTIKPELDQWDPIVKAFGASDTKLLLLARELNQSLPDIPTTLATGDVNLFNIVSSNDIPAYQFKGFPMSDLADIVKKYLIAPVKIDWTSVLEDIQEETIAESLEVKLTLQTRRSLPRWIHELPNDTLEEDNLLSKLRFAEGIGLIYDGGTGKSRRFGWCLPYEELGTSIPYKGSSLSDWSDEINKSTNDDQLTVDTEKETFQLEFYLGHGTLDVSEKVIELIIDRIHNCSDPLAYFIDMPTLQSPKTVVELILWLQLARPFLGSDIEGIMQRNVNYVENFNNFIEFGVNWLALTDSIGDIEIDAEENVSDVLRAIERCWSIGETVTFKIIPSSNEEE